jgi:hypothetical protein
MNYEIKLNDFVSYLISLTFFLIGLLNLFYGNDPEFGVFLIILSLFYLPQVNIFIKEKWGFRIPIIFKIVLGIFIIWASLGVGELFGKIAMMMKDI